MSTIRVINGNYRGYSIQNTEFTLVSGFQTGARGGFVTVQNSGHFHKCSDTIRIKVDNISDIEYTNGMTQDNTVHFEKPQVAPQEADEEAMARIREDREEHTSELQSH